MEPEPRPEGRSDNDQQLAADLTHFERVLTAARDDADVQAILAPTPYPPDRLDGLLALVDSARTAYEARTAGMSVEEATSLAKKAAFASARSSYAAFRIIARALFLDDPEALTALGLGDEPARALDPFVTQARAGYAAVSTLGRGGPAAMAEAGYTPERLAVLTAEVNALVDAARGFTAAEERAKTATTTRDTEAEAARKAYATFRDIARVLLPANLRDRIGLG